MKRLAALAAILAMAAVQSVALADFTYPAEYTGGDSDSASVNANGYSTVLITDETGENIVYVNQADSAYSGAQNFLLKSDPAVGKYKVLLGSGSSNASPKETYFYVGVDSNKAADLPMNRLRNEYVDSETGKSNIAYYVMVPINDLSSYHSLKVGYKEGSSNPVYGGFDLSDGTWVYQQYTGSGDVYVIFQLNDVSSTKKDSVAVYLSTDEVVSSSPLGGN